MELGQLSVENQTRAHQVVNDLQSFLGLDVEAGDVALPELKRHHPRHKVAENLSNISVVQEKMMDICLPKYDELRSVLVGIGQRASEWIISYFLESPEVHVSNRHHFHSLLKLWGTDPCSNYN
jgi:hypothetical protein